MAGAVVIGSMMVAYTDRVSGAATGRGSGAAGGATGANSGRSRRGGPELKSNVALVIDAAQGETLYAKHSDQVAPIASITKLMTAMVVLDAQSPLDEVIEIERADVDTRKHTRSRLPVGARLGREVQQGFAGVGNRVRCRLLGGGLHARDPRPHTVRRRRPCRR